MITSLVTLLFIALLRSNAGPLPSSHFACEGMVVSAHPLASEVGLQVLQSGGNAFDAGISVEFALAVVFPIAGNIGGGGFALLHTAEGEIQSLNYREQAPAGISAQLYVDDSGQPLGKKSTEGPLAAGIPGTVAGMYALHQQYGQLPWSSLVQPAIELARKGWVLTFKEVEQIKKYQADLQRLNPEDCYLCATKSFRAGDTLYNEALAATLERIRDHGAAGFYRGPTAEQLVAFMQAKGGIMTASDLENYQAIWRAPLQGQYKGYDVYSMGPPSSGGVLLLQMLGMLETQPLSSWGMGSTQYLHHTSEVARRAYADRALYLGDPDFVEVPLNALLDESYLKRRASSIQAKKATPSSRISGGLPALPESDETTHYIVADGKGNIITATTSLNGAYGSKSIATGLGFLLNNTIDDFSLAPGLPNSYGLVGSTANAIAPGKRMLSSMTPTLVLKEGKPVLAIGSPGGSTIPTTVLQVFLNQLEFGLPAQWAVDFPRFHHQWLPDHIRYENGRLDKKNQRQLKQWGHTLQESAPYGRAETIRFHPDGTLEGGADRRGDDAVRSY
ncbi:MAG: gamma-glutamyltransferase [Sphingobacteriaceae bacterium]|nr:gamma-glutamyltransferase [Sphingobacteriaceae bacterium]